MSATILDEVDAYYQQHYPCEAVCKLLGRAWRGSDALLFREIALETKNDVYLRYQSIASAQGLRAMFRLRRPLKMHVGAIYDSWPCYKRAKTVMKAEERELIFDIDVNDYAGAGVDVGSMESCNRAWPLVAFGMLVLRHVLRQHFGFRNMLLVYSGRRGAHLTVHDARACALTNEERGAIVSHLQPSDKCAEGGRHLFGKLKGAFFGALWETMVLPFWMNWCLKPREQGGYGVLDTPGDRDDFLDLLNNSYAKSTLLLGGLSNGVDAWTCLERWVEVSKYPDSNRRALREAVLTHVWPVLDANVSKDRGHLSKHVLTLHPKTGNLCVPIFEDPSLFDPAQCPKLIDVVNGEPKATQAFNHAVERLEQFATKLSQSQTESWTPPRLAMHLVDTECHNLKGGGALSGRGSAARRVLPHDRLTYSLVRTFELAAANTDPDHVVVYCYNAIAEERRGQEAVGLVPAGSVPPQWPMAAAFPIDRFLRKVREASANPGTPILFAQTDVLALLHPNVTDRAKAAERLEHTLRGSVGDPVELCSLSNKWNPETVHSAATASIVPAWVERTIALCTAYNDPVRVLPLKRPAMWTPDAEDSEHGPVVQTCGPFGPHAR